MIESFIIQEYSKFCFFSVVSSLGNRQEETFSWTKSFLVCFKEKKKEITYQVKIYA